MSPKLKKIARYLFVAANIITIIFYLLACLSPFLDAGKHYYIALLGLVFPLLFFVLLVFLIYWLIRKSKWVFICLAAILFGIPQILVVFSFHTNKKFDSYKAPGSLRVLTWNLSSWGETSRDNNGNNMDSMVAVIKNANPDIPGLAFHFTKRHYSLPFFFLAG